MSQVKSIYLHAVTPLNIEPKIQFRITTKGSKTDLIFHISKTPRNKDHAELRTHFACILGGCYCKGSMYNLKQLESADIFTPMTFQLNSL